MYVGIYMSSVNEADSLWKPKSPRNFDLFYQRYL